MLLDLQLEEMRELHRREQEKFFLDYLAMRFAHPPQPGESQEYRDARLDFERNITPETFKPAPKQYVWNIPPEVLAEYENVPLQLEEGEGG